MSKCFCSAPKALREFASSRFGRGWDHVEAGHGRPHSTGHWWHDDFQGDNIAAHWLLCLCWMNLFDIHKCLLVNRMTSRLLQTHLAGVLWPRWPKQHQRSGRHARLVIDIIACMDTINMIVCTCRCRYDCLDEIAWPAWQPPASWLNSYLPLPPPCRHPIAATPRRSGWRRKWMCTPSTGLLWQAVDRYTSQLGSYVMHQLHFFLLCSFPPLPHHLHCMSDRLRNKTWPPWRHSWSPRAWRYGPLFVVHFASSEMMWRWPMCRWAAKKRTLLRELRVSFHDTINSVCVIFWNRTVLKTQVCRDFEVLVFFRSKSKHCCMFSRKNNESK